MVTKLKKASIAIRQNKHRDLSPSWDGAKNWTAEEFSNRFKRAMDYYRLETSVKDLKPKLVEWMHKSGYEKADISAIRKTKDKYFNGTMLGVAACLVRGMPEVHENANGGKDSGAWLREEIAKVMIRGADDLDEEVEAEPSAVPVKNIQDRLRESAASMSEEIDAAIDSWITDPDSFDPKAFKVLNLLRGKGAKAAHARYIRGFFTRGYEELLELASGNADEQLREAYRHNSRKNVKKLIEFYESIMAACEQIAAEAKVMKKPRAKKIKPAEELVKKLKFCIKEDKLGIVSVPPAQLVGSQSAVLYNVRTRKLAHVVSNSAEGFSVKGTSLVNISEKSFQKTLRSPGTQLKEFKDQNTFKRFDSWFKNNVKTTETVHTGRLNEDTVILKVFK